LHVPEIDRQLGMEVYATKTNGTGGKIKASVDDFIVEEVLVDGSKASVDGAVPRRVLSSIAQRQRFLICVLIKQNWDTFIAVKNVSKALGIDQKKVQFAGIKDARAQTAQFVSIADVPMEAAHAISIKDVALHPIGYVREPLSLFYLLGNRFTINVTSIPRPVEATNEKILQVCRELDAIGGIPNFFGHQRFGTARPISHLVGKALISGDFEKAAMLFLAKPSSNEHPSSRQARQELKDKGDINQALQNFPKQLRFERQMLGHLKDNPGDFIGAFKCLPDKLQALFVQAHQSYLFNLFISRRIECGMPLDTAVEGDFVVGVERSGLALAAFASIVTAQNISDVNVKVKGGKLRVALPLFGLKQKLSGGEMGELERGVLEQECINVDGLKPNELTRVSGKGSLRTVIAPIRDFKSQNVRTEGEESAAMLSFMLYRGSYATILLREIIKPLEPASVGF
jgi:tRNA pseudouridine13 synthase